MQSARACQSPVGRMVKHTFFDCMRLCYSSNTTLYDSCKMMRALDACYVPFNVHTYHIYVLTHVYIYAHVYIYMYAYIYICIHIYTYIQTYIYIYVCVRVHIHVQVYIYKSYQEYLFVYVHTYIYIYIWIYALICKYVYTFFCMGVCLITNVYLCALMLEEKTTGTGRHTCKGNQSKFFFWGHMFW